MKRKKIIAAGIVAALLITTTTPHTSLATQNKSDTNTTTAKQLSSAEISEKSEVVYAKLSAEGDVNAIYVVNHFKVVKSGSIIDYGNYSQVKNLTVSEPIGILGDAVTLFAKEGDFYYQGNMDSKKLPWSFDISYELDGVATTSQELAGRTGALGIRIKTMRNDAIRTDFFEHYMLQISITLASEKSRNIIAEGATYAEAGNNTVLAFTVMPNKSAELHVMADVTDFTMNGIEITAMPFTMNVELPDTGDMLGELEQLPKAISELNDGVKKLAKGSSDLKNGADGIKYGSGDFEARLTELSKNSAGIREASSQIKDALSVISTSINTGSDEADTGSVVQLPAALKELSKGLQGISEGMDQLKEGYTEGYRALDASILAIPDTAVTMDQLKQLFPEVDKEQQAALDQLYASYVAGRTVKATYEKVKKVFASVNPTLENVGANIDTIAGALKEITIQIENSLSGSNLTSQLAQLSSGLGELSKNYSLFDTGLQEYLKGIASISEGYQQFHSGLSDFVSGVGDMNNGVNKLYDGTNTLNKEISKLPDRMQEEIDTLLEEYDGSDFEAISFVSPKNIHTELVQFVIKGDEIKLPEKVNTDTNNTEEKKTVMERFLALFQRKKE